MTSKVIGRVIPNFTGDYDEKKAYTFLDVVVYKGSSYLCKTDNTGQPPDSSASWVLLAKAGEAPDTKEYALIKNVPKVSYDDEKHVLTVNDKTVDLETKQKIDKDNKDTEPKPSDYSEGFSYELKNVTALSLDRSAYDKTAQEGSEGLLTTSAIDGFARQRLEVLDSARPLTFERNGHNDKWNDWELITYWATKQDQEDDKDQSDSSKDDSNKSEADS